MAQRIKKWVLANTLAFQAGVEQADENMAISELVTPTIPIPFVPPPANSTRMPFYMGERRTAVAAEFSHVGLFCSSAAFIVHLKRVDIFNNTGAATSVTFSREDNPISGANTVAIVPLYIDAGPSAIPLDKSIVVDTAVAQRGTSLFSGAPLPILDDEVRQIELDAYIQGGVFWVIENVVNRLLDVAFYGEIIPVIQGQPPG